ncbi:MAG TPA: hypothetical protein VHC69_05680, partial [Polyangiaceae bacterium]|nr:hypothetical protein [Polyangiaceae bacterium]
MRRAGTIAGDCLRPPATRRPSCSGVRRPSCSGVRRPSCSGVHRPSCSVHRPLPGVQRGASSVVQQR